MEKDQKITLSLCVRPLSAEKASCQGEEKSYREREDWMAGRPALYFPVGPQVLLPVIMKLDNNS